MFCPECGKPNPDGSNFCQFCGEHFNESVDSSPCQNESQPNDSYQPNDFGENPVSNGSDLIVNIPKADFSKIVSTIKTKKNIVIPVLSVVVLLIAFFSIGASVTSPKNVAKKYFEAMTKSDYETMYNYVAAPKGDFVNKAAYVKYIENQFSETGNSFEGIKNFDIYEYENINNVQSYFDYDYNEDEQHSTFTRIFIVECVDDVTGYSSTYQIELVKQTGKSFLFFDKYKVALGNSVCQNLSLKVPNGFSVSVDDIALSNPTTDENNLDVYVIATIFNGQHKVKVQSSITEPYEMDMYFSGNDSVESFDFSDFSLNDAALKSLEDKAVADLKRMYDCAVKAAPFSNLSILSTEEYADDLHDNYEYLCDHVTGYYEGTGLKSISFSEYSIKNDEGKKKHSLFNDKGLAVSFSLEYGYNYSESVYVYGEPSLKTEKSSNTGSTQFSYRLVNGNWILNGLSYYNVNY